MTATTHYEPRRTVAAWWQCLAVAAVVLLASTACIGSGDGRQRRVHSVHNGGRGRRRAG